MIAAMIFAVGLILFGVSIVVSIWLGSLTGSIFGAIIIICLGVIIGAGCLGKSMEIADGF